MEGPTWAAWWTQNSYGTSMTSMPFLDPLLFQWTANSQLWWFNNMANGSQPAYEGSQGFAPDGCLCDDGGPTHCDYKQGDGLCPEVACLKRLNRRQATCPFMTGRSRRPSRRW